MYTSVLTNPCASHRNLSARLLGTINVAWLSKPVAGIGSLDSAASNEDQVAATRQTRAVDPRVRSCAIFLSSGIWQVACPSWRPPRRELARTTPAGGGDDTYPQDSDCDDVDPTVTMWITRRPRVSLAGGRWVAFHCRSPRKSIDRTGETGGGDYVIFSQDGRRLARKRIIRADSE
jgi:hypothetical protein